MTEENDVLFENVNNAGVAILNRPKSLNALNHSMITKLLPKLIEWERTKTCVIIKSAGDKAFCAGGDVRALTEEGAIQPQGLPFAFIEYNANYLIGHYKIPYIALINGIAFGGGLGLSIHGQYRVATEKAVVAMPETLIGLLPDVGATYFLPRLQNHIGFYMGLTGKRLKGKDVVISGLGTHYVPSARLNDLENQLALCSNGPEIQRTLDSFSENPGKFSLAAYMQDINYCFSGSTVEEIIQRLSEVNNEWAKDTLEIISRMCPTSLKVTLRALHHGRQLDLGRCLQMEYRVVKRFNESYNFKEGGTFVTLITFWPDVGDKRVAAKIARIATYIFWWIFMSRITAVYLLVLAISICLSHQYTNLQMYFKSLDDIFHPRNVSQSIKEARYERALRVGIKLHANTIWCTQQVEKTCGMVFSGHIIVNIAVLVLLMSQMVNNDRTISNTLPITATIASMLFSTGLIMWNVGDVTVEAAHLPTAMFLSGWQNCQDEASHRIRRLLLIAITQSQKPVVIKCLGFITLSYQSYLSIVKTSYSIFSVLF